MRKVKTIPITPTYLADLSGLVVECERNKVEAEKIIKENDGEIRRLGNLHRASIYKHFEKLYDIIDKYDLSKVVGRDEDVGMIQCYHSVIGKFVTGAFGRCGSYGMWREHCELAEESIVIKDGLIIELFDYEFSWSRRIGVPVDLFFDLRKLENYLKKMTKIKGTSGRK